MKFDKYKLIYLFWFVDLYNSIVFGEEEEEFFIIINLMKLLEGLFGLVMLYLIENSDNEWSCLYFSKRVLFVCFRCFSDMCFLWDWGQYVNLVGVLCINIGS